MQNIESLHYLPVWGIFPFVLLLVLLSIEGGFRLADRRQKRFGQEKEAPVGAMVGALLGLLAFLLVFSFGIAADGFHARRQAVVDEANAIGTAYQRTDLIPEPHRTEVRKILREYVEERLDWAGVKNTQGHRSAKELHRQLWAHTATVGERANEVTPLFILSVNEMIDLWAERVLLRDHSRIPAAFQVILIVLAVLTHAAMGYHSRVAGTNRSPVMLAVAIAFSLVLMLNADLDRTGEGFINVSQQAMIDMRDSMIESKP
ncbi:MAG: hypothetical protein ACR65R_15115 [Methylomicrobium sp.]